MAAAAEVLRATALPMRNWWRKTGYWLLLGMALVWLLAEWVMLPLNIYGAENSQTPIGLLVVVSLFAPLIAFGMPATWLYAAYRLQRLWRADASLLSEHAVARRRQGLFLAMLLQGIAPLAVFWLLRTGVHALSYRMAAPLTFSYLDVFHGAGVAFLAILSSLPAILLSLALLVATERLTLPAVIYLFSFANDAALVTISSQSGSTGPWEPRYWWLWECKLLLSAVILYLLLRGLLSARSELWKPARALLIGGLALEPLLKLANQQYSDWALWFWLQLSSATGYLLFEHRAVGEWLARVYASEYPPERTLLGFAAPLITVLWTLLWHGGLFMFFYWLLGQDWKQNEATAASEALAPVAQA